MVTLGRTLATASLICLMSECLNGGESRTLFEDLGPVRAMPTGTYRGMTGSIVKLRDGSLLWALPALGDAPLTGIVGRISADGGRTWGKSFSMQPSVPGVEELICPNLRRLPSGELLFFYTMLIWARPFPRIAARPGRRSN